MGSAYQAEFLSAWEFGARYAGFLSRPAESPGAWIAFRESLTDLGGYNKAHTDYGFFLRRAAPDASEGMDARRDGAPVPAQANRTRAGLFAIGPADQRHGAWARRLPAGGAGMTLAWDEAFQRGAAGAKVDLAVTLLDAVPGGRRGEKKGGARLTVALGGQVYSAQVGSSGRWRRVVWEGVAMRGPEAGATLQLRAEGADVVLHMVEVVKR